MKNKKTLKIIISSALLWLIMLLIIIAFGVSLIIVVWLNPIQKNKILTIPAKIFTLLAKHLCGIDYTIIGTEHMIPGPAIIAVNHQSLWETMSFTSIFPPFVTVLKSELLKIPIYGWGLRQLSAIAINRAEGAKSLLKILSQGNKRIKQGFWIMIFPQGTRIEPGVDAEYKTGVSKMAIGLKLPIIPVSHNSGYCMPKGSFLLYPGTITVVISPAIYPKAKANTEDLTLQIKQIIEKQIKPL